MNSCTEYNNAVQAIKAAILQSQYEAARSVNEKQLMLYYGIGKYISLNSRKGFWGTGAIDAISEQLSRELPGLRGFTARNLRYMRTFYEEWQMLDTQVPPPQTEKSADLEIAISKMPETQSDGLTDTAQNLELMNSKTPTSIIPIWNLQVPNYPDFPMDEFLKIGFTHHRVIISKAKELGERIFYIQKCAGEHLTVDDLEKSILNDDFRHQGSLSNNFLRALPAGVQAFRAINTFKDEYLLDFINVEELNVRDDADIDERVIEYSIVHNVKNFILAFGKDFAFIRNQYHLDAFGEDQYIDLLFFNRALNCLVAVELKTGKFKTSYLGQLQGYLSILDGFERKPHENPSIGLILCKDMNKSFVDYVIQDYSKPMGVATYKTSKDMSEELRNALPDVEALKSLLDSDRI